MNTPVKIKRPKVTVYIACSIDGYIAREDGSLDFLDQVGSSDDDYGYSELINNIDCLIMGRKTYETACTAPEWPYKSKRSIVLSNALENPQEHAEVFNGELEDLLAMLEADQIKHAWVDGGITIAQFLEQGYVDDLIISIVPTLIGSGIPLFPKRLIGSNCKLVSSESYASGLVQLRYKLL